MSASTITTLLAIEPSRGNNKGAEYIIQYSAGDMAELFTAAQITALAAGQVVTTAHGIKWVDAFVAARNVVNTAG